MVLLLKKNRDCVVAAMACSVEKKQRRNHSMVVGSLTAWSHLTVDIVRGENGRSGTEGKEKFLDGPQELLNISMVHLRFCLKQPNMMEHLNFTNPFR